MSIKLKGIGSSDGIAIAQVFLLENLSSLLVKQKFLILIQKLKKWNNVLKNQ